MKGALHIHTTYSDGDFTLSELRDVLMAAGCRFACVTDHAEYFDAGKLDKYRDERTALAAYNAGQENVDRWRASGEGIAFGETRHYVKRVEHLQTLYRRGYHDRLYGGA